MLGAVWLQEGMMMGDGVHSVEWADCELQYRVRDQRAVLRVGLTPICLRQFPLVTNRAMLLAPPRWYRGTPVG